MNTEYVDVPIDEIIIGDRKREINLGNIEQLKDSISKNGLLQPIVITPDKKLVIGLHRLTSCKSLNHTVIKAVVKEYNAIDAELAEIDENLVRTDLTTIERAIQLARRKQIYEFKYPETTVAGRKKTVAAPQPVEPSDTELNWIESGEQGEEDDVTGSVGENMETETGIIPESGTNLTSSSTADTTVTVPPKPFIKDTAELTGRSSTVVRDEANLGELLLEKLSDEVRRLIAPTKLADNKREIYRLLDEEDKDTQLKVATLIHDSFVADPNKQLTVSDALKQISGDSTYENTVADTGETTLLNALKRNEKLLSSAVNNPDFEEMAKKWTYEGIEDVREQMFYIENLLRKGYKTLTEIMDAKYAGTHEESKLPESLYFDDDEDSSDDFSEPFERSDEEEEI